MNILMVEDNEAMRRLLRNIVGAPPWRCHECADGSQALAAYAQHRPDWVFVDIDMKTADGIAIAGQLHTAFPEAKIVFVTNHDDADLRQAAQAAGACGYVLKESLFEVRRLLEAAG